MWPKTCCRFSVPTRTRYSPSPPASREPQVVWPSKSPTLVISSPHWLASRLTTFTPSPAPSRSAEAGERKWTWVSAVTQPRSRQGSTFSSSTMISSVAGVTSNTRRMGRISNPFDTST